MPPAERQEKKHFLQRTPAGVARGDHDLGMVNFDVTAETPSGHSFAGLNRQKK
jgi:hypothetical protein